MQPFVFKQFVIHQNQTAMKIGTDAVLLGSWADITHASSVLDIGTGTGILSLMVAQRNKKAEITAVEIEERAYKQALFNFQNSKWANRITLQHIDIQNFNTQGKFDTVISNPPFYDNQHFTPDTTRTLARHTSTLSFSELIEKSVSLLTENGFFHVIIPHSSENKFLMMAQSFNLHPSRILRVRGNKDSPLKRSLITLSFHPKNTQETELIIEKSRHQYTKDYINLTKDFYLKM
ncbi:MAG: tRNA1(Val) (adenine(37)-N6)-methyltransferase [Flavobacteriales bacterium]